MLSEFTGICEIGGTVCGLVQISSCDVLFLICLIRSLYCLKGVRERTRSTFELKMQENIEPRFNARNCSIRGFKEYLCRFTVILGKYKFKNRHGVLVGKCSNICTKCSTTKDNTPDESFYQLLFCSTDTL